MTVTANSLPDGFLAEIFDPVPSSGPRFGVASVTGGAVTTPQPYGMLSTTDDLAPTSMIGLLLDLRLAPTYLFGATHVAPDHTPGSGQEAGANGPAAPAAGRTGLRINTLAARFDYFLVVTRETTCPMAVIQ